MIKVIAASSIFIMREGMKKILASCQDMEIIGEVSCADDVLQEYDGQGEIIVLIAHPLRYRDRHEFYIRLRCELPNCRIVAFVRTDNSEYVSSAIRAGARGILTTDCASHHVADAIRAVSAGKVYLGEDVSLMIAQELKLSAGNHSRARLTERELQILKRIAIGRKTSTIAEELCISAKTVSAHKANILEKLALATESELVLYAIENKLFDLFVDHSKRKPPAAVDGAPVMGLRSRGRAPG
jgi:DNA-binding NarL/FixJ family response regulator